MDNTKTKQILFISAGIAGIAILTLFVYCFLNKKQSNHYDSLVLITDKTGDEQYGTGFFIEGEPGKCTVVT